MALLALAGCNVKSPEVNNTEAQRLERIADERIPSQVRSALEKADQFVLLSLDPKMDMMQDQREIPKDNFHGWKVLGRTEIKDASTRRKLIAAFRKGVADHDGSIAKCFLPRHGLHLVHEGKPMDLVICFECLQVEVHCGEKEETGFLISKSPLSVFNEVLLQAGIPLPKQATK
jgi:hypothetical protein